MRRANQARRAAAERDPGPPPDAGRLQQAALDHLARFAATEAGLRQVLVRRIERWGRRAEAAGQEAETVAAAVAGAKPLAAQVAARLVAAGAVDDAGFAAARARRLARSGRSGRAIAAHLAAKGVASATVREMVPRDAEAELDAALAFCRRRRLGPFAAAPGDEVPLKALAALARNGFSRETAGAALGMAPEAAAARIEAQRRGG